MRLSVLLIFSFFIITTTADLSVCFARDVSFTWTANTDETDGYRLYILAGSTGGITKNNYTEIIELNKTTDYTCQGLDDKQTYHFALTAFRNIGNLESGFSTEITVLPIGDDTTDSYFNQLEIVGYSNQDREGTVTVEDRGATLALTGNRWVKTIQYYDITQETVLEFDFKSTIQGEIHGIGFDEDDELTNDKRIIPFFGTQIWSSAIKNEQRYLRSDMGTWVHFVIPVGRYFTGKNMNLVFVNDHDNAPANATGWFSNVKVYEMATAPSAR